MVRTSTPQQAESPTKQAVANWEPKETVVVPIDYSESAAPAIREALGLAKRPDCVHVLHVLEKVDAAAPGGTWGPIDEGKLLDSGRQHLATWLAANEIEGVRQDVVTGDPGIMTVEYADDCHADLIVIPSHGYNGLKHMWHGSVAELVIRHARCPVFVLRRHDAQ